MNDTTAVPDAPAESHAPGGSHAPAGFQYQRLHRSRRDRMIAGVCRGIEDAYGIDAALSRVVLVVTSVLGFGVGILAYLTCWILVPLEPEPAAGAWAPGGPAAPEDPR